MLGSPLLAQAQTSTGSVGPTVSPSHTLTPPRFTPTAGNSPAPSRTVEPAGSPAASAPASGSPGASAPPGSPVASPSAPSPAASAPPPPPSPTETPKPPPPPQTETLKATPPPPTSTPFRRTYIPPTPTPTLDVFAASVAPPPPANAMPVLAPSFTPTFTDTPSPTATPTPQPVAAAIAPPPDRSEDQTCRTAGCSVPWRLIVFLGLLAVVARGRMGPVWVWTREAGSVIVVAVCAPWRKLFGWRPFRRRTAVLGVEAEEPGG